jgi:hypothetical protein
MNAVELAESAAADECPPSDSSVLEQCLWHARAGKWDASHDLCQEVPGAAGSWVHGWLHRQEGDLGNAGYWYSRAGREMPPADLSLEDEWMQIATELLS